MKIITIEEHYQSANVSKKMDEINATANPEQKQTNKAGLEMAKNFLSSTDDIEDVGERRIKFMDEAGIDMQVIAYGNGNPQTLTDAKAAIALCQEANDELASMIRKNPTRFAGFASLPVADPMAAATELERAVKVHGFKGAMLAGTFEGKFFDDPQFLPIFAKAEELNVPIYMHPSIIAKEISDYYFNSTEWSPMLTATFASAGYGWHMDVGIHVIRLILSGMFDKLPNLKIISGHWGEFVPYFLERMDETMLRSMTGLKRNISDYYRNHVYITPSGLFSVPQLQFVIAEMGADHVIYSGDYPYLIDTKSREFLETAPISDEDREKIAHLNVEKLLGLGE
ncbi:amidohydrolase [Listeria booriae]|uniref:Amidohydrolase n=1 Tax=Listeria booriae TaxID=1552123 RepID=A0A7X1A7I4_9LIST|nr:amidohydrolase family protein [Listeria booriae]MBC2372719.1 amidohydrolase [Listeria booriae]